VNVTEMMTPAQVAAEFGVNSKTVTRWARSGKVGCIRTPGGHRRFRRSDIEALLAAGSST
jgi:excisionase family DNA binding protein